MRSVKRCSKTMPSNRWTLYDKLEEAALYIERNRKLVKSIASFPYIVKSS